MIKDLEFSASWGGGIRLKTEGLNKLVRSFTKAGVDASEMRDLMHAIGETVVDAARPRTPYLHGDLRKTLRAGRGKTKAVVRAGGKAAIYAPIQHYGWEARHIPAKPFLTQALAVTKPKIYAQLEDGIEAILKRNNLK